MSALEVFCARHTKHKLRLPACNPVTLKKEPVCPYETSVPIRKLRAPQLGRKIMKIIPAGETYVK